MKPNLAATFYLRGNHAFTVTVYSRLSSFKQNASKKSAGIDLDSFVFSTPFFQFGHRDRLEQIERQRERDRKLREQQKEQREFKDRERRAEERRKEREARRDGQCTIPLYLLNHRHSNTATLSTLANVIFPKQLSKSVRCFGQLNLFMYCNSVKTACSLSLCLDDSLIIFIFL